jgi:hypothetical protein
MVLILHVQIMYNVHKQLTTISTIFIYFTSPASSKTDEIGFAQNRSDKLVKPIDLSVFYLVY